jgi:murein tripeptide amidase MpaA
MRAIASSALRGCGGWYVAAGVVALAATGVVARSHTTSWFSAYRDLAAIDARMDALAAADPESVHVFSLGASVEGRPIRAIEISHGGALHIAIDGGQHAREWIAVMAPVCIADRLAHGDGDARIRRVLESVTFDIVPVVNPDGYAYTWEHDRSWRKNRRGGYGVDLNRNFSVGWGEPGSSGDRSSPNYRGDAPFSEPETRALASLFDRAPIAAHIDFHSFSQVITYPWSHQRTPPRDEQRFAAIAARMSTAMATAHGEHYAVRAGSELTVGASGTAGDWSYGDRGALSFLVELRPANRRGGGFELPPDQIEPTCDEAMASVLALADAVIAARSSP